MSVLLLLVGSGFGPPLLGILTSVFALLSGRPRRGSPGPATRLGGRLWPEVLVVAVVCFLGLVRGTALLYAAVGLNDSTLVAVLTGGAFVGTALAMWAASSHDRLHTIEQEAAP